MQCHATQASRGRLSLFPPLLWTPSLTRGRIIWRIVLARAKAPLFFGLPALRGDALFGASFSLEQKDALPPPPRAASAIVMPAALNGAIPFFHALHEEQCLLFFAELVVRSHRWHCHEAARAEANLSELDILQRIRSGGSEALSRCPRRKF